MAGLYALNEPHALRLDQLSLNRKLAPRSMGESLFTRLVAYSQNPAKKSLENFVTEVLAYLINSDQVFRTSFLHFLLAKRSLLKAFKHASARPQQSFGNGIVDLVLIAGDRQILIEIKVGAPETLTKIYGNGWVPQIRKYLSYKQGPVAYLTTKASPTPDVGSKRFLGQVFFEDLYDQIKGKSLTAPGKLSLQFMEENDMKPIEPLTEKEIRAASEAFSFAKKCEAILNEIKTEVEPKFRKMFHTKARFTRAHFSPTYESAYAYTPKVENGKVRYLYIWIQLTDEALAYGIALSIARTGIKRLNRYLQWSEEGNQIYSTHPIRPGCKSHLYAAQILSDLKKLKSALNHVY